MILQQGKVSRWGEMYATVDQRDINGRPVTVVGTSMNIDRQKDIERSLIEARNKAEESDRLKSAFLANISHEIRTPLNAIVGFSDVLSMAQSEEERTQLVNLIKQNNAQLLRLFDDMVNMSKLDAGGDAVKKEHFDLKTLLTELVDRYQPEYDKKGIELQTSMQDTGLQLYTDRGRLREILNQYLNNALKFTEKGSVTIGYELRGEHVRLWVRDTGKGIPVEHCNEHLFERFFKVDEFIAGTGLGLSICRSLAQTLGGTVGVQSKEGAGSLFWVEIALE
jgi:signal transduction histidine kinase